MVYCIFAGFLYEIMESWGSWKFRGALFSDISPTHDPVVKATGEREVAKVDGQGCGEKKRENKSKIQ